MGEYTEPQNVVEDLELIIYKAEEAFLETDREHGFISQIARRRQINEIIGMEKALLAVKEYELKKGSVGI